jgi:hypothetical protein
MDYLVEAQKFIRFAQKASHPNVIGENLKIAAGWGGLTLLAILA